MSDAAAPHFTGRALLASRLLWAAAALTALIALVAGTPVRYFQLFTPNPQGASIVGQLLPEEARLLAQSGLSMQAYASYITAAEMLTVLVSLSVAGLIAWGRSDNWMAWYVSLILVSTAAALPLVTVLQPTHKLWSDLVLCGQMVFFGGLIPLIYLFPDGRFAPSWTRWLAVAWLIYMAFWPVFPSLRPTFGFRRDLTASEALVILWLMIWFLAGVLAQVWRYRHYSNTLERQRTKWVMFGFALLLVCGVGAVAAFTYLPIAAAGLGYLAARLAGPSLILLGLNLMAMSIGVSILRYRLYDIDVIIRRTLLYSVLTALLALAYFLTVLVLQAPLRILTGPGQNQLVTVASTLAIAALFVPLRRRLQSAIDRRLYRRKYDAGKTIAAFGSTLRNEVELNRLTTLLLEVVDATMQPAQASLWLKGSTRPDVDGGQA